MGCLKLKQESVPAHELFTTDLGSAGLQCIVFILNIIGL